MPPCPDGCRVARRASFRCAGRVVVCRALLDVVHHARFLFSSQTIQHVFDHGIDLSAPPVSLLAVVFRRGRFGRRPTATDRHQRTRHVGKVLQRHKSLLGVLPKRVHARNARPHGLRRDGILGRTTERVQRHAKQLLVVVQHDFKRSQLSGQNVAVQRRRGWRGWRGWCGWCGWCGCVGGDQVPMNDVAPSERGTVSGQVPFALVEAGLQGRVFGQFGTRGQHAG